MKLIAVTILALLVVQGVGAARRGPDPDELAAAYTEAFNANDAARLAAFFAEDAVLMPPDTPTIRGRAAIEAAYHSRFAQLRLGTLHMQRLDFDTHDDRATTVGTFTLTSSGDPSDMRPTGSGRGGTNSGKYVVIYKRTRDHWLIAFQIMNYDFPQAR